MRIAIIIIYVLFCYGYMTGLDDGIKWRWQDYVILPLAPVIVPALFGRMVCRFIGLRRRK